VEIFTAATLLHRLRAAHLLAGHAAIDDRKGRATWVDGELLHRLSVRRGAEGQTAWTYHLGDGELGKPFPEGGILALVQLRTVAPLDVSWPTGEGEVGPWMAKMGAVVALASRFVHGRRQFAEILLSPEPLASGQIVADLGGRYAEQVVRAFAIADATDDLDLLVRVLDVLRHPEPGVEGAGATTLLSQAQYWADQWSHQSGREIVLPTSVADADAVVAQLTAAVPLRTPAPGDGTREFWDHVG
jgi:hypothetical protein